MAAVVGVVVWRLWGKLTLSIHAVYAFLIFAATVLNRQPFTGEHFQPIPFWSWKEWKIQKNQILRNVIVFVPIGCLSGWLWKWKGLLFSIVLSLSIELLQLISKRGLCELDDVLHNCIGTTVGIGIVMLMREVMKRTGDNR